MTPFAGKVNERLRPPNHGPFEAKKAFYPQGAAMFGARWRANAIFLVFRRTRLLTLCRARAYIRAIDGGCSAPLSRSFLLIVDVDGAFRGLKLRRLLDAPASRLFDIIGRKRSADGGFFAVSAGFRLCGNEKG